MNTNAAIPVERKILRRIVVASSGCWEWQGWANREGYGVIALTVAPYVRKAAFTHRVSYEAFRGPLTPGLVIDHLCRNVICCNPWHLEEVTQAENKARGLASHTKTHCKRGHEFTTENTYRRGNSRTCRTCNRAAVARYQSRRAGRR